MQEVPICNAEEGMLAPELGWGAGWGLWQEDSRSLGMDELTLVMRSLG